MILRPSKIFVSFHQLRHYFQQKISELVVSHPQQPSHAVTQLKNFSTTQQNILFFSEINRSLIQKAYSLQQHPVKRHPLNEKLLLKVIQRHFPIVKVFSQPTLHGRVWATTHPTQHLRTMMSSSSQNGGGTAFMTWGFPRTAMVGVGRTNNGFAGATRQFSTTKAPTCANLFQNTAAVTQQPNVFTHVSSRIFSPAGSKMNQPPSSDEKPKYVPFYSLEKDLSSDEESVCSNSSGDYYYYNRIFQQNTNKGMGDLVNSNYDTCEKRLYVRRESTATGARNGNKRPASVKKLDSIVRHDDISSLHTTEGGTATKRKLQHARQHNGRTKHPPPAKSPPDHLHHVKRKEDSTTKRKLSHASSSNTNPAVTNVYILITLDTAPFLSTWSTQSLNSSFIDSVETIAHNYQLHLHHVLSLLDCLRYSGKKFRVVARNAELRIYFPATTSIQSEYDAIEFLKRINVDQDDDYFTIIVEDQEGHYFSLDHHAKAIATPVVGPDYFKDLQMFLDRTDYLIEASASVFGGSGSDH